MTPPLLQPGDAAAPAALGCDPDAAAEFLRALAHPMRLRILCRLLDGECAVAAFESELGLKQPNLSQQLAALREAGLVATRRESKSVVYRLADDRVAQVLGALRAAMMGVAPPAAPPLVVTAVAAPAIPGGIPAAVPSTPGGIRPVAPQRPIAITAKAPPRPGGEAGVFAVAGWDLAPASGRRP